MIPLLKSIPAGFPEQINEEAISDYISLPDLPKGCFAIIADGDFMAPTIRDGDLVIFSPGGAIGNRSIVLMNNKWGEVIMRRYRIKGSEAYFSPENSVYAPFKADTDTKIFGTVIDIWRKVKI
ncbi:MAG: S24 family peptidase [Geobacteraceae bacterium]|nr:S24 family peptidase [Geobacteraceae bacterium]